MTVCQYVCIDVTIWTRPFASLSEGQHARAILALSLRTGAVVDDFGATVDELTARSCPAAIGKAARSLGLRRVLLATSHMSLVPYLGPDWVVTLPSSNSLDLSLHVCLSLLGRSQGFQVLCQRAAC